ncbi:MULTISPECIES: putative Ig domain-containing protein [Kordiimonas]|jgi:Ca2+-binding RTX toxin-like protein|uniref:putative Ig domain-containing protein n=1 Tax=Kordiimonas TaxID=288021 RepID=UPI0025801AF6|nr:putative Ig domain-containing protein [Kordiimonas sp. UBA4487]
MSTITVLNTNDSGPGSLREALAVAVDGDEIVFDASLSGQTITLASELHVAVGVSLSGDVDGDGRADIILSGNDAVRVLTVDAGSAVVTIEHLFLVNGNAGTGQGGALHVASGDVTFSHGHIYHSSGAEGGGVYNAGTLTLDGATVAHNASTGDGGGIFNDAGTLTLQTSTVADNHAQGEGGGVAVYGGEALVSHSTISANIASGPEGIHGLYLTDNSVAGVAADVSVGHTILADNIGNYDGETHDVGGGAINSLGYNLFSSRGGHAVDGADATDVYGEAFLGSLADNGGAVETMTLYMQSDARNAGDAGFASSEPDQNGNARVAGGAVDIGAVEMQNAVVTYHVSTTGDDDTGDGSEANPFATIQHAIDLANNADDTYIEVASGLYNEHLVIRDKANISISVEDAADGPVQLWNYHEELAQTNSGAWTFAGVFPGHAENPAVYNDHNFAVWYVDVPVDSVGSNFNRHAPILKLDPDGEASREMTVDGAYNFIHAVYNSTDAGVLLVDNGISPEDLLANTKDAAEFYSDFDGDGMARIYIYTNNKDAAVELGMTEADLSSSTPNPNEIPVYVGGAYEETLFIRESSNIFIDGRDENGNGQHIEFGIGTQSAVHLRYGNTGVGLVGLDINDARYLVYAETNNREPLKDFFVYGNQLDGNLPENMAWYHVKSSYSSHGTQVGRAGENIDDYTNPPKGDYDYRVMETSGIRIIGSSTYDVDNVRIYDNDLANTFDGINVSAGAVGDNGVLIHNNFVSASQDDGIDIIGLSNTPVFVFANHIYDVKTGISYFPAEEGGSGGDTGWFSFYNNTMTTDRMKSDYHNFETGEFVFDDASWTIKIPNEADGVRVYGNSFYDSTGNFIYASNQLTQSTNDLMFVRNLFLSGDNGVINESGLADYVTYQNNLFWSLIMDTPDGEGRVYYHDVDGDGNNYERWADLVASGNLPATWTGNVEGDPFVTFTGSEAFPAYLALGAGSAAYGLINGATPSPFLPLTWAGATEINRQITVGAEPYNQAPVIGTQADMDATVGAAFSLSVALLATDLDAGFLADNDSVTYKAAMADGSALPDWLHFDARTASLFGTPASGDVGAVHVRITATDDDGAQASTDFSLTVSVANTSPVLDLADDASVYPEYGAPIPLDAAAIIADADGDSDWVGGSLSIQITGGAYASDRLFLDDSNGTGPLLTVSGQDLLADGVDVGDLNNVGGAVMGGDTLEVIFSEGITGDIVQEFLQAIWFEALFDGDDSSFLTRTVSATATDAHGETGSDSRDIVVEPINDDPVMAGLPETLTVAEDTLSFLDLSSATLTDDSGPYLIDVTLSVGTGTLVANSSAGVSVSGSGTDALQLTGTVADIDAYLDDTEALQYLGEANDDGATILTIVANDGGNLGVGGGGDVLLGEVEIDILGENDAPLNDGRTLTLNVGAHVTISEDALGFSDPDGDTLDGIRINSLPESGQLVLLGLGSDADTAVPLAVGDYVDATMLETGRLVYQAPDSQYGPGVASFGYTVSDGSLFATAGSMVSFDIRAIQPPEDNSGSTDSGGTSNGQISSPLDMVLDGDGGRVTGTDLDDRIFGGAGDDTIDAGAGDDKLLGGQGADHIKAGGGNDRVFAGRGDQGDDTLEGGSGADLVGGGAGADHIDAGGGNDQVFGATGDDVIIGGGGNDLIFGGSGNDLVEGGSGDDTVWAGDGNDTLGGGSGADTFIFGRVSGNDIITDFDLAEDSLNLRYALVDFANVDAVVAASSETVLAGQPGLLINLGGGNSVFIESMTVTDLSEMTLVI